MARSSRLEDMLAALRKAREDPSADASLATVRKALTSRSGHAAAKAAALAGQYELTDVKPELLAAFDHFMSHVGADPGCAAKASIAEALYRMAHGEPDVFLRGIRHVQMEPVFGGKVDTAVDLRGASALGLVRMGHRGALFELAELLADREAPARISTARALAYRGGEDGAPLLLLKLRLGDPEARVISECLTALLRLTPSRALPVAERLLEHPDAEIAEGAALALGESRAEGAFELLHAWCERRTGTESEAAGLMAMSLLRREDAIEYLLALVSGGPEATACRAVAALGLAQHDERIAKRMREAARSRSGRVVDALRKAQPSEG